MKRSVLLTIAPLLTILLITVHLSEDIVRGFVPGGVKNIIAVLILAVWLFRLRLLASGTS